MESNTMMSLRNVTISRIRSKFLLAFGFHLGGNGLLILMMYTLVTQISIQEGRELLGWLVPTAQGCCFVAAILLAAGLAVRNSNAFDEEVSTSGGWGFSRILSFGKERLLARHPVKEAKQPEIDADQTLSLLKDLDWKVFRDLGIAYFREFGFRVADAGDRTLGVDFFLYTKGDYSAVGVRCLPRGTERVDLKQVRNVHRAMLLAGVGEGVMLTTGAFDEEALAFGEGNGFQLLSGERFVKRLLSLPPDTSRRLLHDAAEAECIRLGRSA